MLNNTKPKEKEIIGNFRRNYILVRRRKFYLKRGDVFYFNIIYLADTVLQPFSF